MSIILEDDQVIISRKYYDNLIEAYIFLNKLKAAGVDNWEGYEFVLDDDDFDEDGNEYIYGQG